ncbi:MAG: hypothetical protein WBN85_01835 [Candidatus Macondimonas sp.]
MNMFYLVFEVRPTEQGGVLGGAYVHCWVNRESAEIASFHAASRLRDAGWIIDSGSEPVLVRREDFLHDEVALEGFDMATREGDALQMHGWVFEGDA